MEPSAVDELQQLLHSLGEDDDDDEYTPHGKPLNENHCVKLARTSMENSLRSGNGACGSVASVKIDEFYKTREYCYKVDYLITAYKHHFRRPLVQKRIHGNVNSLKNAQNSKRVIRN